MKTVPQAPHCHTSKSKQMKTNNAPPQQLLFKITQEKYFHPLAAEMERETYKVNNHGSSSFLLNSCTGAAGMKCWGHGLAPSSGRISRPSAVRTREGAAGQGAERAPSLIRSAGTEGHCLVPSRAPKAPSQAGWPSAHALGGCGRQRDLHTPPEPPRCTLLGSQGTYTHAA